MLEDHAPGRGVEAEEPSERRAVGQDVAGRGLQDEFGVYSESKGSHWRVVFLFKILFIHDRHRERQRHRQREKQAACREPNAGLDPRTRDHTLSQRQMLNY